MNMQAAGATSGTSADSKPWTLKARIVSVSFVDGEKMTRDGADVTGPHWTLAGKKDCQEDWGARAKRIKARRKWYSKKPAAYVWPGKKKVKVEVEIYENENVSGDAKLVGRLGPIEIEGTCGTSVKTHTVEAEIKAWSDCIDGRAGEMSWSLNLSSPATSVPIRGKTFVELYQLLRAPVQPMYGAGLPAEVIRFLCQKPLSAGKRTPQEIAEAITAYFHWKRGLTYHVRGGATFYGVDRTGPNPAFPAADCALRKRNTVNCYDQAASVQSMCGAVGVAVEFIYMDPYGFISGHLVGVKGRCNNPFYAMPNPYDGTITNMPYLKDRNDKRRTAFGNHAFNRISSKILDACAGPHLGSETLDEYVANAIDHATTLNALYGLPGTETDAAPQAGVVGIDPAVSV